MSLFFDIWISLWKPLKNFGHYILIYIFKSQALVLFLLWSFPHIIIYTQYKGLYFAPWLFFCPSTLAKWFLSSHLKFTQTQLCWKRYDLRHWICRLKFASWQQGQKDKNKLGIYFPEYSRETSSQKQVSVLLVHCIMFVL